MTTEQSSQLLKLIKDLKTFSVFTNKVEMTNAHLKSNHLRHANQKHKAISPHSSKNDYYQKDKRYTLAALYTVGGNVNQQGHYGKQNEECQS